MGKEDGKGLEESDVVCDGVIHEACAACCRVCRSTHGEGMPRSSSMPRFFKTLTEYSTAPSPICSLQIPASYIRNHIGVSRKKKFVLEAAPGCEWPVTFHSVAFEAGWKEFAVDYELEKGDGIMFSLVDRRRFHVNVFDKFGMEKLSTKQRASPTHSTSVGAEDRCRTHGLLQPMPNRNHGHNEPVGDETEPSTTSYSSDDTEDSLQVRLAKAILANTRRRKLKERKTSCTLAPPAVVAKTTQREAAACEMLQNEGTSNEGQIDSPALGDEAMFEIPTEEGARVSPDITRPTLIIEASNVTRNGDVEEEAPHIAQTMETGEGVKLSMGAEAEAEDHRPSPVFSAGTVKLEPDLGLHQPSVKCAHCGLRRDLPPAKCEPVLTTENQEATGLGGVKTSEARSYPRSTAPRATENQKQKALAAAKELSISLKNPNALVVMRTSMPDTSYDCFLSVKCSEMLPSVPTELILMDPEGVARRINWNGQRYMSGPGWIDFVDSHNLQIADVWVMEVIDRSEHNFVVKAHILHAYKIKSLSEVKPPTPAAVAAPVPTASMTPAVVTAPVPTASMTPAVVTAPVPTAPTTTALVPALLPVLGTPAPLLVCTGARTRSSSHKPVPLVPSKSRKRTRTLKQLDEFVEIPKPSFQDPKPSSEVPSPFKIQRLCAINTTEDDRALMEPLKPTASKRPRRGSFTSSPSTLGIQGRDSTSTSVIGEEPSRQKKKFAAKSAAQEVKKSKGTRRRHSLYMPHVHRKDKSENMVAASQSASKVQLRSSMTDESPENLKQVRSRNSQRPHYKVAKMIDRRRSLGGVVFLVELSERVSIPRNSRRLKAQQDEKGRWWVPHNHFSKDFTSCYIE